MQIAIDIPEEYYNATKAIPNIQCDADMLIIKSGTPQYTDDRCKECKKDWTKCAKCPVMMKWIKSIEQNG